MIRRPYNPPPMKSSSILHWVACATVALGGCGPHRERERLNSYNARERAQAAVRLAGAHDANAVHCLVPLLYDGDSAVRMYAILSLEDLTGETFGYRYYDPEEERSAAIERWQAALREGRVQVRGTGRTSPATSQPAGM